MKGELKQEKNKLERLEEKYRKQSEQNLLSTEETEEIEIKRHEVEGFSEELTNATNEQKEVFLTIFQVSEEFMKSSLCNTVLCSQNHYYIIPLMSL